MQRGYKYGIMDFYKDKYQGCLNATPSLSQTLHLFFGMPYICNKMQKVRNFVVFTSHGLVDFVIYHGWSMKLIKSE